MLWIFLFFHRFLILLGMLVNCEEVCMCVNEPASMYAKMYCYFCFFSNKKIFSERISLHV